MDDSVGTALTIFVIALFVVGLFVAVVLRIIPFSVERDYSIVAGNYLDKAVRNGGLTDDEVDDLVSELENINDNLVVDSTNISRVGTVGYEEEVVFEISATYTFYTRNGLLTFEEDSLPFTYNRNFTNYNLIN